MESKQASVINQFARTLLAEIVAVIVVTAERQGRLEEFNDKTSLLRTLVGPARLEQFLSESKIIWDELKVNTVAPLLRDSYKDSRKRLKKATAKKKFDQQWAENLLFGTSEEDWLSDKELWGWIQQLDDFEKFSSELMAHTKKKGVAKVLEDLGNGIDAKELIRKIETMDFTMSELRLLQLVLGLIAEPKVVPIEIPKDPKMALPVGREQ